MRRTTWVALMILVALLWLAPTADAQEGSGADDPFWKSDTCLGCHQQSGLSVALPSGETLRLAVYAGDYDDSVHGRTGVACRNCHLDITGFPHPDLTAGSRAEYSAQQAASCEMCHRDHYGKVADELHLASGGLLCFDCHDPHKAGSSDPVAAEVQPACNECHTEGVVVPAEGIHAAPEVPDRESTSSTTILLVLGGALVGFVVLVWLATVAWRAIRERA